MQNLILLGENGAIRSTLITEGLKIFNHIYAIYKKFNKSITPCKVTLITLDILDPNAGKNILSKITNTKYNFYIGFAQRPFVNILPDKLTDDIVDAIKLSLISSLDIFEYLQKTLKINSVFFLRSINSFLAYDGGKSKMIADSVIHFQIDDMQIAEDTQLIISQICMQWLNKNKPIESL